jgi:FAD/FMN-containing dehydrogenase
LALLRERLIEDGAYQTNGINQSHPSNKFRAGDEFYVASKDQLIRINRRKAWRPRGTRKTFCGSDQPASRCGAVDWVLWPQTEAQAAALVYELEQQGIAWRPLGSGSNVLADDGELHYAIVSLKALKADRCSMVIACP